MIEISVLFAEYLLSYFFFRNSALGMIAEVRTNFRLYEKHYKLPPRWLRKHFRLKKDEIPKYLLFRLYVSISFGIMAPISIVICLASQLNSLVVGIMLFIPCVFVIPDSIVFIILSSIFKRH